MARKRAGKAVRNQKKAGEEKTPTSQPHDVNASGEHKRGLLPGDLIKDYGLIDANTWEEECLRSSSYNLRFGEKYYPCCSDDIDASIDVPPNFAVKGFESILFSTKEIIDLSEHDDIIARFGLKMRFALQGLILQVGPQVEPRYKGRLFGLLYNTTSTPIVIGRGEEFLTIEFERLARVPVCKQPEGETYLTLDEFLGSRQLNPSKQAWRSRVNLLQLFSEEACKDRHVEVKNWFSDQLSGKGIAQNNDMINQNKRLLFWTKLMTVLAVLMILVSVALAFKGNIASWLKPPPPTQSAPVSVPGSTDRGFRQPSDTSQAPHAEPRGGNEREVEPPDQQGGMK